MKWNLKNATEPLQNFNNQEVLKTLFLINKTFNEFGNEVHGDVEHPKENNLKVEEVNHEQNLDSVYESSEFKHDICKKYWKKNFLNCIELKQMKFNILEIYVMYQQFLVQVTL